MLIRKEAHVLDLAVLKSVGYSSGPLRRIV